MYTKKRFSFINMVKWTRIETFWFMLLATAVVVLHNVLGLTFLQVPWTPVALIGTAVAFIIGFQNSAAYGRIWEARKIWGGVVNSSRSWGMKIQDMVTNEHAQDIMSDSEIKEEQRKLIYRHIAWMTALRYAMRQPKSWEVATHHKTNKEWQHIVHPPEWDTPLEEALDDYLTDKEKQYVLEKGNKQTALLYLQSRHIRKLKDSGHIWEFAFLELEALLEELFNLQGKSERIKNFPYPRQYATLGHNFTLMFLLLLPFGIVPAFTKMGTELLVSFPRFAPYFEWLAIPFCMIVSWIFHTMDRIGRTGENPFEGTANDVPISTISRGIEIDLRQMLDEDPETIPKQFEEKIHVQM